MSDKPELERTLVRGVDFRMEPTDDAELRVQAYDTVDGRRAIYSATHARDWFTSRQTRATIRNNIVENVPDGVDSDGVRQALEDLFTQLDAKADEVKQKLQPPDVAHILNNTTAVRVFGGEDTRFFVDLEIDGRETTLDFSAGEWANDSPAPLKTQYANEYYGVLELDAEQWREIRRTWQDDLVEMGREEQTTEEMVAVQVLETLKKKVKPVDDTKPLKNDIHAALWDAPADERAEDDDRGRQITSADVPSDEPVLWVQSQAVVSALSDAGRDEDFVSNLSVTLREEGYSHSSSSRHRVNGDRTYFYPFVPSALNVGFMDVHEPDSDDEEVEP
ncbi:hypothetical protein ACOZ4F_19985 [Haloarcula marismortui]|uniref:hypothetical protein n=1 Tax=Haloarcula marismortui TaxID=2238 RepID=UPI003C754AD9